MAIEDKLQFLYASLADIQSTIRAIDSKVSYLLVLLFLPMTKLGAIYCRIHALLTHGVLWISVVVGVLAVIFSLLWFLGFWCALRTIIAIDDPKQHIDGDRPESSFYPASLFNFGFFDIMGMSKTQSRIQFKKHFETIPDDPKEIAGQLTLEQMKTMYIASLKLKRSVQAYQVTIMWVGFGGLLWLFHLVVI